MSLIRPKLIVVSAASGAGKTTLCQKLLAEYPQLVLSISSTTRAPRGEEKHAREYFFLTKQEFEQQISAGRFAEWARVHDNLYGTSKDVIEGAFSQGKSVLLDIDVQGSASLRTSYSDQCYSIFISVPSLDELEARLRSRGTDSEATIQKRLKNAREEIARSHEFDLVILNDSLDRAYRELRQAVERQIGAPGTLGAPETAKAHG